VSDRVPYEVFKRAIIQRESGGRYGVPNAEGSGAMGIGQVMPETAKALAARLGLPYNPNLMLGKSPEAMRYQDQITDAAVREAYDAGGSGRDPLRSAHYYHAGPNQRGWGRKTQAYGRGILEKIGQGSMQDWAPEEEQPSMVGPDFLDQEQSPLDVAAAAPSMGAQSQGPQGSLDALLERRRKSVAEMYDAAAAKLQAAYKGPSTNDLLLALGAGMLQPTRSGSFGEAIGNSLSSMLPFLQDRNKFRNTVAEKVAGLDMQKAKDLGDLEEKYLVAQIKGQSPGPQTWSESLGRFVARDIPSVISVGSTADGRRVEKMSDGKMRVFTDDRTYTLHDTGGRVIGQGEI